MMAYSFAAIRSYFPVVLHAAMVDVPEADMDIQSITSLQRPPLRKDPSGYGQIDIENFERLCEGTVMPTEAQCSRLVQWCIENNEKNALVWWMEKGRADRLHAVGPFPDSETMLVYLLSKCSRIHRLSLENLSLSDEFSKELADALVLNGNLTDIELCRVQLEGNALTHLAEALKLQKRLKEIKICLSKLNGHDLHGLIDALKGHQKIKLILSSNALGLEDIQAIFASIRENDNVCNLELIGEQIDEQGMRAIGDYIKATSALKQLSFSINECASESGPVLAEALAENRSVVDARIMSNIFEPGIGIDFSNFLIKNQTVSTLALFDNDLSENDVTGIAGGLKENTRLQQLSLCTSHFSNNGAIALASALRTNANLRVLDLAGCSFESDAGEMLCDAMRVNTTLEEIKLDNSNLSAAHQTRIRDLCARNRAAGRSTAQDALVYSRVTSSAVLPPELGAVLANHVLMRSSSDTAYESVTTEVALSIRALANDRQTREQQAGRAADRTQEVPEGGVLV